MRPRQSIHRVNRFVGPRRPLPLLLAAVDLEGLRAVLGLADRHDGVTVHVDGAVPGQGLNILVHRFLRARDEEKAVRYAHLGAADIGAFRHLAVADDAYRLALRGWLDEGAGRGGQGQGADDCHPYCHTR
jgi:hypothetical protein